MGTADPRATLESLIRERGEDYASLSRLIGRNAAYIQQFVKRGVPRRLAEEDRRMLARYFGIPETALGGPPERRPRAIPADRAGARHADLVLVPRLDIGASAGHGATPDEEHAHSRLGFERGWLREMVGGSPSALSAIRVSGDSMVPTLADGDEILVDRNDAADRLRDGLYVLRIDDALVVKRVALSPVGGRIAIRSDNPAYPGWPDCDPAVVTVIGRVVWAGRRVA